MKRWLWSIAIAFVALVVVLVVIYVSLFSGRSEGTRIGTVSTTFRFIGPNDTVALSRFDDDAVDGVSCFLARARTGGIGGAVGTAEDPSRLSLSCIATGVVKPRNNAKFSELSGRNVFSERASVLFKTIDVHRFFDAERNALCYVAISTKLIEGSPANATACINVATAK